MKRLIFVATALGVSATIASSLHASAPAGRYTISAGTVYDTRTRLTWQQGYSGTSTWADAGTACSNLGIGGGNFRLPTLKELLTLVDYSVPSSSAPTIDTTAFPNTPADYFWTSTPQWGSAGNAWTVLFKYGDATPVGTTSPSYVRCVR